MPGHPSTYFFTKGSIPQNSLARNQGALLILWPSARPPIGRAPGRKLLLEALLSAILRPASPIFRSAAIVTTSDSTASIARLRCVSIGATVPAIIAKGFAARSGCLALGDHRSLSP